MCRGTFRKYQGKVSKIHLFKANYLPLPCLRVQCEVRMRHFTKFQGARFGLPTGNRSCKMILPRDNRKVSERNFPGIPCSNRRRSYISSILSIDSGALGQGRTVKLCLNFLCCDTQPKVTPIVTLLPHHLLVTRNHASRVIPSLWFNGTRLASRTNRGTRKLDADGSLASLHIIVLGAKPRQVRDLEIIRLAPFAEHPTTFLHPYPVLVTISGEEDVISDVIIVEMLQCSVSVRDVALVLLASAFTLGEGQSTYVPVIAAHATFIVLKNTRKDNLISNNSPGSPSFL